MSRRLSWHEARAVAADAASALPAEIVPLEAAIGRTLVADLVTPIDVPHFASSAMDGWLVAGPAPWKLVDGPPSAGQARAIVTGALVPPDSTAVLRSESGVVVDGWLESTVVDEPRSGQHIRQPATEAARGETVIAAGTLLNPAHLALAASTGADRFAVLARPDVALVLTGDEVVTAGVPSPGHVRDSFGVQFPALFALLGARVSSVTRVGDDLPGTIAAIRNSTAALVVTTGGSGQSSVDHIHAALRVLGAEILIGGVAMRPGGPTTVGRLADGRLVACLPGNPLAATIAAITICEPLIAGLAGRVPVTAEAVAGPAVDGRPGSTLLIPYAIVDETASITPWRGSGMMRGLADAAGILVVPEAGIVSGTLAETIDVPW